MDKLRIPNNPKTRMDILVLTAGVCVYVYIAAGAFQLTERSSGLQSLLPWCLAIAMAACTLGLLAYLFEETATHLAASKPPLLVTTKTWFGKFTTRKHLEIDNAAWVRARRIVSDSETLVVEIGTHGYQTVTINCYPYAEKNIPIATTLCAEIAEFLKLEDKGYVNFA